MPIRKTSTAQATDRVLQNCSYESLCASWFMQDGWQVFLPLLDHGHKTDLLVSDGPNYYRIQIKTIEAQDEHTEVANNWRGSSVQFVVYFAKNSNWGYIVPAFATKSARLDAAGGRKFDQRKNSFSKAFHSL